MKRIIGTAISFGILALASPSFGADLAAYTKAPAYATPAYDWSGFYFGAFGGGGYGNHNINNATGPVSPSANYTANISSKGGLAGGEFGYNWQSGSIVAGIEADGFWSNIKGSDSVDVAAGNFPIASVDSDNLRWGGTVRVRGGYTVDRLMMFFTGGYAFGSIQHTNVDPVLGTDRFTSTRSGLTAGGGIAYALTNNLIGKLEYRYYNYGSFSRPGLPTLTANGQLPFSVASTYSVVTIGLDYKFGGPVVVAKY